MAQSWQSQSEGSPEREGAEEGITPSPSFEGRTSEEGRERVKKGDEEKDEEGSAAEGTSSIYDQKNTEQKGVDLSDTESLVEEDSTPGPGRQFQ